MPSLHTVRLTQFDTRSAACMQQLNAAVREGALVHMEVRRLGKEGLTCPPGLQG
jgi:hypothetical protein